ncbi:protein of unknown function [Streptomyces murinus]
MSRNRSSASGPSPSRAAATVWREPESITARRTSPAAAPVARARPSTATASRAPWRTSPVSRPRRKRCSASVAAPSSAPTSRARSAWEPGPDTRPSSVRAASTSRTVSVASAAAGTRRPSTFQPTPSRPCGSRPARYGMTTGTSSASASRNSSASNATFRDLAAVAATSPETSASRLSNMPSECRRAPPVARCECDGLGFRCPVRVRCGWSRRSPRPWGRACARRRVCGIDNWVC